MSDAIEVAHQVAERAEAARIAEHYAALQAMRELGKPLAPPDPVEVIDHKMASLDDLYAHTVWDEFKAEADRIYIDSMATLQRARVETVRLDEAKVGHPV